MGSNHDRIDADLVAGSITVDQFLLESRAAAWRAARTRTRNDAEADDVVTESMTRFWQATLHGRLDGHPSPLGYLLRIVHNTSVDHRRIRERQASLHALDPVDGVDRPEDAAERDHDDVVDMLDQVPDHQRDAVLLVDGHELSHEEAGRILGLGPNAVRQLVFRGRRKLRLVWAERVAGASVSAACDAAVLRLAKDLDDPDGSAHADECGRCRRVREAVRHQRWRRPVVLLPWPVVGPIRRHLRRPVVAGAVAGGLLASVAAASALHQREGAPEPQASSPTVSAPATSTTEPADDRGTPPTPVQIQVPPTGGTVEGGGHPEGVGPTTTQSSWGDPSTAADTESRPDGAPESPVSTTPPAAPAIRIVVDVGEVAVEVEAGPPTSDQLEIIVDP